MPAQFVDIGALLGFACEAVLYGINVVVFFLALNILWPRVKRRGSNQVILILSLLLFLSCTAHFALEFNHYHFTLKTTGVDGFADETNVYFAADLFISITDFFGDLILIYRCWLIWSGDYYICILPTLTSVGGLVCAAVVGHLVHGGHGATPSPSIVPLGLASFALPFCTNVMCTLLIAARIWHLSRSAQARPAFSTRSAAAIFLESGMLYFLVQLVFLTLYGMDHPGEQVIIPMAVQVYGIASFLIVIQAGLGLSIETRGRARDGNPQGTTWGHLLLSHANPAHLTSKGGVGGISKSEGIEEFELRSRIESDTTDHAGATPDIVAV
ncbi:hypothetical protein PsYK624_015650 [Phanerochaete sordida]|uniref:Uncharacterized protein n=1 Tax=Phanerochaete sordida TaxID=48140 RepID=A0A9P3FZK9_9APHY|nr:hypothetical protein PsYK624_015650 [Phanerochaete sordida]